MIFLGDKIHGSGRSELLSRQVSDIQLDDSVLHSLQTQLSDNLEKKGFEYFFPVLYWGDEWLCEDGKASISVPFYLGNKYIAKILYGNKVEVEGCRSNSLAMRYIRHEAGHAFFHAFGLKNSAKANKIFGDFSAPYNPDNFRQYRNAEKYHEFINNIFVRGYGQVHPEEDFAETFAEWLNPRINWREKYIGNSKILRKLRYMETTAPQFYSTKLNKRLYSYSPISRSQYILRDILPLLPQARSRAER